MKYNNSILKAAAILVMLFTTVWVDAAVWKIDSGLLNKAGQKDTINLMIDQNDVQFASFQVDLTFPEGLSPVGDPSMPETMSDGHKVDWQDLGGNAFRCVAYNNNNNLVKGTNGVLLSIPVQISEDFTAGSIVASKGLIAKKNSESYEIAEYRGELMVSKEIVVTVSGLLQTITPGKAAELTIETVEPAELKDLLTVSYYKDEACSTPATEADRQNEGTIYAKVSFPGKDEYLPYTAVYPMELKAKKIIQVEVSGLEQYADSKKAAELTIVSTEPSTAKDSITISYYKDKACATPATEADRMKEGIIYAKVSYPGNEIYAAYEKVYDMVLKPKNRIKVEISGTEQKADAGKAAELTILSVDPKELKDSLNVSYFKNNECTVEATDSDRKQPGTIYAKVYYPGNDKYEEFNEIYSINIKGNDIKVVYSGSIQTVNPSKAAVLTIDSVIPASLKEQVSINYYTDEECNNIAGEDARKLSGTFYVKLYFKGNNLYNEFNQIVRMTVNNKLNFDNPEVILSNSSFSLEKGSNLYNLDLSSCEFRNKGTEISGTFSWEKPNHIVTETDYCKILFLPEDENYNVWDTTVKVNVIPEFKVYALNKPGGTVQITGQVSDSLYNENQKLELIAYPDNNYKVSGWFKNGESLNNTDKKLNVVVSEDAVYSVEFTQIMHTVTVTPSPNGKITVKAGGKEISTGESLPQGTSLSISAIPNEGYELENLNVDGSNSTAITLQKPVTISATFVEERQDMFSVKLKAGDNGSVQMFNVADGSRILSGSKVAVGTRVRIETLSDAGYELDDNGIVVNGKEYDGNPYMINEDIEVTANFKAKQFDYMIVVKDNEGTTLREESSAKVVFGQVIDIDVPEYEDGNLLYALANGTKVGDGDQITITGNMTVTAVYEEKVDIDSCYIMYPHQSYYYNGVSRNFVPFASQTYAGFDFKVEYELIQDGLGNPVSGTSLKETVTDAGVYNVHLYRKADALYKEFDEVFVKGLEIKQSTVKVTAAPDDGKGNPKTSPENTNIKSTTERNYIKYTIEPISDSDKNNYKGTVYYYTTNEQGNVNVTISNGSVLRSTSGPKVVVTNAGLDVKGKGDTYSLTPGTKVTLSFEANDDFKFIEWSDGNTDISREYVVPTSSGESVYPKFERKKVLDLKLKNNTSDYTGQPQLISLNEESLASDCLIAVYDNEECLGNPVVLKNIGTYWVKVTRPADDNYSSFEQKFEYTINRKTVYEESIEKPEASDVLAGETLSQSVLMGGNAGIVPGTFTWVNPNTKLTEESGEYEVMFTPSDPNYNKVTFKVKVNAIGGTKSEGETDPENPTDPTDPSEPTDPEEPTSLEDIEARTIITSHNQIINVIPAVPMNLTVINMTGNMIYNGLISTEGKIDVRTPGVYILKMNFGENTLVKKINVR